MPDTTTKPVKIWGCKIGETANVPDGGDFPMRAAVERAYRELTGEDPAFIFSGWGAELTEPERAVHEDREPSAEYEAAWHAVRDGGADRSPDEVVAAMREAITQTLSAFDSTAYVGGPSVQEAWRVMEEKLGPYRFEHKGANPDA